MILLLYTLHQLTDDTWYCHVTIGGQELHGYGSTKEKAIEDLKLQWHGLEAL